MEIAGCDRVSIQFVHTVTLYNNGVTLSVATYQENGSSDIIRQQCYHTPQQHAPVSTDPMLLSGEFLARNITEDRSKYPS
jgi:hypothetical protein